MIAKSPKNAIVYVVFWKDGFYNFDPNQVLDLIRPNQPVPDLSAAKFQRVDPSVASRILRENSWRREREH